MTRYVPRKGDIIAVSFDPQSGREQRGRRPALVVSNDLFNRHTGLCVVCPVTSTRRDHPFHVELPDGLPVAGVVMVEQVRSLDYRARRVKRICRSPQSIVDNVLALLDASLY